LQLTCLDWCRIALYFIINGAIGFCYNCRAGKNVCKFFLSGRIPRWLAGAAMVASTFAANTPLDRHLSASPNWVRFANRPVPRTEIIKNCPTCHDLPHDTGTVSRACFTRLPDRDSDRDSLTWPVDSYRMPLTSHETI
jgi:hypothetical protein